MFRGTQNVKLDGKGRLVIPSRTRELIEAQDSGMVVTAHPDNYLLLFLRHKYEELERKVVEQPETTPKAVYYKQTLIGMADDSISFDSAGRISLSQTLREHADLSSIVAVMGMGEHLRFWSKEKLDGLKEKVLKKSEAGSTPEGWDGFTI